MVKKKIAFICVHNSCRSQIAEALGKHLRGNDFDFYSAETETKPQINQDAVRLMKQLYGIDMEQTQYGKTYEKIPAPDIAISMGVMLAVRSLAEPSIIIGACLTRQDKVMIFSNPLLSR